MNARTAYIAFVTYPFIRQFKSCMQLRQSAFQRISGMWSIPCFKTLISISNTIEQSIRKAPLRRITCTGGFSLGILGFFENEPSVEESIVMYIKKAILATQREEYDAAEENLSIAFYKCKKYALEDALTQVVSYQANLALKRGNLTKAENLFKFLSQRLINLKQATLTDNSFVEVSLKLAEIYARTGKPDEAMSGFQYCVVAQKRKIEAGAEDEDTLMLGAWSLHNLSQMYLRFASPGNKDDFHLSRAVNCLEEAYALVLQALGPEAEQVLALKSDLASAVALQGNHSTALKIYQEIASVAKEENLELYSNVQLNIANLHLQKSEFKEASRICWEAKNLAKSFKTMDVFRRAEECLRKSHAGKQLGAKA